LKPIDEFFEIELKTGILTIENGLWFWDDKVFILAKSNLKTKVLQEFHDSIMGGHGGY